MCQQVVSRDHLHTHFPYLQDACNDYGCPSPVISFPNVRHRRSIFLVFRTALWEAYAPRQRSARDKSSGSPHMPRIVHRPRTFCRTYCEGVNHTVGEARMGGVARSCRPDCLSTGQLLRMEPWQNNPGIVLLAPVRLFKCHGISLSSPRFPRKPGVELKHLFD